MESAFYDMGPGDDLKELWDSDLVDPVSFYFMLNIIYTIIKQITYSYECNYILQTLLFVFIESNGKHNNLILKQ